MRRVPLALVAGLTAAVLFLSCRSGLSAGEIVFKDGFTVTGTFKRDNRLTVDPETGRAVPIPQGFVILDDVVRRISFPHTQLDALEKSDEATPPDTMKLESRVSRYNVPPLPAFWEAVAVSDFDGSWERNLRMNTPDGRVKVRQRLSLLTPRIARFDTIEYNWSSYNLTTEIGPDLLTRLLYKHPDLKDKKDLTKRLRVHQFLAAVGWYDHAAEELRAIRKEFPNEKTRVEEAAARFKKLQAVHVLQEIERGYRAGRHRWVREQLSKFSEDEVDAKLLARVRALRAAYETATEAFDLTARLLKELPPRLAFTPQRTLFIEAAAVIQADLDLDDFLADPTAPNKFAGNDRAQRLEPFVSLAQQAERDRAKGREVTHSAEQLLALAVSGWLLGKQAAETRIAVAERLWRTRQFLLKYQTTSDVEGRQALLKAYQGRRDESVSVDEVAQLVAFLPPPTPEPPAKVSDKPALVETVPATSRKKPVSYWVQLPHEYRHSRPYPVILALHNGGEKPEAMFERFGSMAARSGYILVAPEWEQLTSAEYQYSPEEQAAAFDVLRDLLRHYHVDSDRVFVAGHGEGGNMAFDVGLGRPDLFAGVIAVSARPRYFAVRSWQNAQYLPLYVVDGDQSVAVTKVNGLQFKEWVPRGYPAIHVQYKGRGLEWFDGEVPAMFDWMDCKKDNHRRARGWPELGKHGNGGPFGEEFRTMRPTDNRFYWLSTDSINSRYLNTIDRWRNQTRPATFQGRVGAGNQISVNVVGPQQLTVWLSREMIDFDKPVTVRVNGTPMWANRRVVPSLTTLLEDFYQRGDRRRLFLARIDFESL